MISRLLIVFLMVPCSIAGALPIDSLWKSEVFQKSFTAAYGVDSRIEPKVSSAEKEVLNVVTKKMAEEDRAGAIALLAESSLLPSSAVMIFNLGSLQFEQGQREEAIGNFRRALELYPNFRDAHRNLAVSLVQGGDHEGAEPHLRRALELGSYDGLTVGLLGYCHSLSGRPHAALQSYRMAAMTMPGELQWKLGEAVSLAALGRLSAAASIYEELLAASPERIEWWVYLADVQLPLGKPTAAITSLEVARRLGGLDASQMFLLGQLYLNASLSGRAMHYFRQGLQGDSSPLLNEVLDAVESLIQRRRLDDAKELVDMIRRVAGYREELKEGKKTAARLERAISIIELWAGDAEAGANRLVELVGDNPFDGFGLLVLAEYWQAKGDAERAIMLLERASLVSPYAAEAHRRRGGILVGRGDYAAGLMALRKAQDLEPGNLLAEYIRGVERLERLFERE